MISCASEELSGESYEEFSQNRNYSALKNILDNNNVIVSTASTNNWFVA